MRVSREAAAGGDEPRSRDASDEPVRDPPASGAGEPTATAATPTDADRSADADPPERCCSRRTVLGAVAGTAAMMAPVSGSAASAGTGATLQVNLYPGPTPVYGRLRDGVGGLTSDWTSAHDAAATAIADALAQIERHAAETGREWIDVAVDRGDPIGAPLAASSPLDAVAPASRIYDRFREAIDESGGRSDAACHLLLWWGPFDYEIGYGRTLPGEAPVGVGDRPATLAVANVGATEGWDGRSVTRNMAIHETLHAYLSSSDAAATSGSRCEHDLGGVREPAPGVREVSPMATAYTGGSGSDGAWRRLVGGVRSDTPGGTRWNGRGCVDRAALVAEESADDGATWRHSTALTAETKAAVCRYAERTLG